MHLSDALCEVGASIARVCCVENEIALGENFAVRVKDDHILTRIMRFYACKCCRFEGGVAIAQLPNRLNIIGHGRCNFEIGP